MHTPDTPATTFDPSVAIARLDQIITEQLDAILHHPCFQRMERSWRGLAWVVAQIDFRENIQLLVVNCSADDLSSDFERVATIPQSGLYALVYRDVYEQPDAHPYGVVIVDAALDPREHVALMMNLSTVGALAAAAVLVSVSAEYFGLGSYGELEGEGRRLPELAPAQNAFDRFTSFRESEDARFLGLCVSEFLLRAPHCVRGRLHYDESVGCYDDHAWGGAHLALAACIGRSFARFRWCPNIIGPEDGRLTELDVWTPPSIERAIGGALIFSERSEFVLSELGFIPLVALSRSPGCVEFLSANSAQKPKYFGQSEEGREAELNHRLCTQLPFSFITLRLAHYLKVLARDKLEQGSSMQEIDQALNRYIASYCADANVIAPEERGKRPLRKTLVTVREANGKWRFDLRVRPHFKYYGAFFTLVYVGMLEPPTPTQASR